MAKNLLESKPGKKELVLSSGKNEENICARNRITRQLFCCFRTESEQGSIFSIADRKPRKRSFYPINVYKFFTIKYQNLFFFVTREGREKNMVNV
jgi:hypothetical protein